MKFKINLYSKLTTLLRQQSDDNSFYSNLRPLAIFSKLIGGFPIKNTTKEGKDLYYTLLSWETFASVLLHPVLSCTIYYFFQSYLKFYEFKIAVTAFVASVANVCFMFGNTKLVSLIQTIEQFDVDFRLYNISFENKRSDYYKLFWFVFGALYNFCVITLYLLFLNRGQHCTNFIACTEIIIIVCFTYYPYQIQTVLYLFFCHELTVRFDYLNKSCLMFVKSIFNQNKYIHEYEKYFEKQRLLHIELANCIRLLDNIVGFQLAVIFCLLYYEVLSVLYYMTFILRQPDSYSILSTLSFGYMVYLIATRTEFLVYNVRRFNCLHAFTFVIISLE